MVRPRNPLNIGACARALANFGLSDLWVVAPYEPHWKEARSAPGAEGLLKRARLAKTLEDALKGVSLIVGTSSFHQRAMQHAALPAAELRTFVSQQKGVARWALLFGSERSGLSNEELARCQAVAHIPTSPKTPSMNLGQAVAVILYAWRMGGETKSPASAVSSQDQELLMQTLIRLAEQADYPPGYTPAARMARFRMGLKELRWTEEGHRLMLSFVRRVGHKLVKRPG